MSKQEPFIEITNQDIYQRILKIEESVNETLIQARKTNGRVTAIEKKSIGVWVALNPVKFLLLALTVIALTVGDLTPIVEAFKSFLL